MDSHDNVSNSGHKHHPARQWQLPAQRLPELCVSDAARFAANCLYMYDVDADVQKLHSKS